jgi:hypothetical protein
MEDVKGTYVVDSKGIFAENRGYFRRNFSLGVALDIYTRMNGA